MWIMEGPMYVSVHAAHHMVIMEPKEVIMEPKETVKICFHGCPILLFLFSNYLFKSFLVTHACCMFFEFGRFPFYYSTGKRPRQSSGCMSTK